MKDEIVEKITEKSFKEVSTNQMAWGVINNFYHLLLKKTIKNNELMLNKTLNPKNTILELVEQAEHFGVKIEISLKPDKVKENYGK